MKKTFTALVGFAIIVSAANARIGESIETCAKRYGEPVKVKLDDNQTGVAIYDKNDLTIKIHFTLGRADLIRYSPGEVARVDLETARYLLGINGRDKEWSQLTKTEEIIYDVRDINAQKPRVEVIDPILWKTKDDILEASYSNSQGILEIKASTWQMRIRKDL